MRHLTPLFLLLSWLPAQAGAARLEGAILDPHQQPVVGALVIASRSGREVARTYSDGSGVFVLARLPAAELTVRATTKTPDIGGALADLRDGDGAFLRIAMMPARRVTGVVRDANGAAMGAAFVVCVPPGPEHLGAIAATALSDANGRAEFSHMPYGPVALRAWLPDRAGVATIVDGTADVAAVLTFTDDAPQRRRFRLHDASPAQFDAALLHVTAFAGKARVPLPTAVAAPARDAGDGSWLALGWPGDDEMRARVVLADAFVEPVEHDIPPDAGDRTKDFWVADAAESFIRGTLFGDAKIRVGNRRLVAVGGRHGGGDRTQGVTEPDGTFVMPTPTPTNTAFSLYCVDLDVVLVPPPSRWFFERRGVVLEHDTDVHHDIEVRSTKTLRAMVLDSDGAPYPGASITLLGPLTGAHQSVARIGHGGYHGVSSGDVLARHHTSARGELVLSDAGLMNEGQNLTLQCFGPRGCLLRQLVLDSDDLDLGELRASAGAEIRGRVLRADGTPWPGARIEITNHALTRHEHWLTADREGRFTVRGLGEGQTWVGIVGTDRGALRDLRNERIEELILR